MDQSQGQVKVNSIPNQKERHSISYDGGYDYVDFAKHDEDPNNHSIQHDSQANECYKAFQETYRSELEQFKSCADNNLKKSINREQFEGLAPEIRMHLIFDQDSGQVYDYRNGEVVQDIPTLHFNKQKAWEGYWKQSNRLKDEFLDAAETGDEKKVKFLLDRKSKGQYYDVNAKGLDDWTALHYASNEANLEIIKILIQFEANVNSTTTSKRTPLHLAVMRGALLVSQELIKAGGEVNFQDSEFYTPLHLASLYGHDQLVGLLLDNKADPTIKNHQNFTALDICQNSRVLKLFESKGIKKENNGYSRTQIGEMVLPNGRNDHILKFLSQKPNFQTQQQQKEKEDITKTPPTKKNKFFNFTKVQISNGGSQEVVDIILYQIIKFDRISVTDFEFFQLLGKGSFGEVYLVEKKGGKLPQKQYAMKILKKERMISQNLMRYAQTEKDVLSIMNHPFIVRLNFAFQNQTRLFLVMDLCSGGDLSAYMDIKRKLPESVAKIYIAEILLALEALHKSCIIFRDLKPENVVLDSEGHAMLTDFGLSKRGVQDDVLNKSFCGSPAYLAPEILSKQGHNRQVDWYLLGVMTYELLVGLPPYYANEREQLFDNIKKGPLKMPRTLSLEAKDFIIQLLNRDPYKRLGSGRDAEEIKEHAWLKEINWEDCYARLITHLLKVLRKLKVPKPEQKQFSKIPMNVTFPDDDNIQNDIGQWTFIE